MKYIDKPIVRMLIPVVFLLLVGLLPPISKLTGQERDRQVIPARPRVNSQAPQGTETAAPVAQLAPRESGATDRPPTIAPRDEPVLQEILRIRRSQGSVLKGTLLESDDEDGTAEFIERLKDVSGSPVSPPATLAPRPGPHGSAPLPAPGTLLPIQGINAAHMNVDPAVKTLFLCCHQLETQATELNLQGRHDDAKRLRALAAQLRDEAIAMQKEQKVDSPAKH